MTKCNRAATRFVGGFDSLSPESSPLTGLPVYVARVPAAPFCETPGYSLAPDTEALQFKVETWAVCKRPLLGESLTMYSTNAYAARSKTSPLAPFSFERRD